MNQNNVRTIDHYEIRDLIGHGGMSTVYRAHDTRLDRNVAVKLIDNVEAKGVDFQARFLAMVNTLTKLDHPHIIHVYDAGLRDGNLFLAMELIEGQTLRSHLNAQLARGQFLDLQEIVSISRQVAYALSYAHEQSVAHMDLKPDNVLLKQAGGGLTAVLGDFGLAKQVAGVEPVEGSHKLSGTLAYMAPELFRQIEVDNRVDIYAFGVMLYELVTGRLPFNSASPTDLVLMHTQGEPERVMDLRPDAPNALGSIIHRAMLKNPNDRFDTALEIARELEALEKSIRLITNPPSLKMGRIAVPAPNIGPATIYDVLPALDRPAIPVDLLSEGSEDVIVVTTFEGKSWRVPFEKSTATVGRESTADIHLDDLRVSRQHVRIDRLLDGKIAVADLGSLNGLYVGDEKVPKGGTAEWSPAHSLKIGPFWLTQRLSKSPVAEGRRLVLATPSAVEANMGSQHATLKLSPAEAVVEPGHPVTVRLEIFNKTPDAHYYTIQIKGLAESWYTALPFALYVPTGMRSERAITIHPPRIPTTIPNLYNYTINVSPRDDTEQVTSLSAILHVVKYYDYESSIQVGNHGFNVLISNNGNSERYYVIETRERDNSLIMLPSRTRILAKPGESTPVEIQVRAKRRPITGIERKRSIDIFLRTDGLPPQTKTCEFTIRPLLSWDMLVLFFLALGLLLMLLQNR